MYTRARVRTADMGRAIKSTHSIVVATILPFELRQIVFMKVNRRSSRGNCGDAFVRSLRTVLLPPCSWLIMIS